MDFVRHALNVLAYPYWSFTLVLIAFGLMLRSKGLWTKRGGLILLVAGVFFFLVSLLDPNFYLIVAKADNVPIVMMVFLVGFFVWFAMHKAVANDARVSRGEPLFEKTEVEDRIFTWPDLVFSEFICMVVLTVVMVVWSIVLKAPLEEPANPALAPNPSKAPWYFLGLQEMLVYFDPWLAGVVLPGLIIVGLMAIPYIDTNPKGNGYFTFRERKVEISLFLFGLLVLWSQMIVIGTFLRGPNWNFFGPYEFWDPNKVEALVNVDLSEYFWIKLLHTGLPGNWLVRELPGILLIGAYFFVLPVLLQTDALVQEVLREDGSAPLLRGGHPVPLHDAAADQDVLPVAVQPEILRSRSGVLLQHLAVDEELQVDATENTAREASRPSLRFRSHEYGVRLELAGAPGGDAMDVFRGLRPAVEAAPVRVPQPGAAEAGQGSGGREAEAQPERAGAAQAGSGAGAEGPRPAPQGRRRAGEGGRGPEAPQVLLRRRGLEGRQGERGRRPSSSTTSRCRRATGRHRASAVPASKSATAPWPTPRHSATRNGRWTPRRRARPSWLPSRRR